MLKKMLMTGLMVAVVLSASACGKDSGAASGTVEDTPVADSQTTEAPQSTETETQASAEESPQPTEEPAEEVSASYIFSDMPIAAYEITGLGIGPDEEVYQENIIDPEDDYDFGVVPLVKLNPSNTFILFCLLGDNEDYISTATIHSPSGSSQWEGTIYSCLDATMPEIEGYTSGYPCLVKQSTFDEGSKDGCIESLVDPWTEYIRFLELYHPDAPQEDVIHAIEVVPFLYEADFDEADEVMAEMVNTFFKIGATDVQEIPVEDALERFNIIVSEEGEN